MKSTEPDNSNSQSHAQFLNLLVYLMDDYNTFILNCLFFCTLCLCHVLEKRIFIAKLLANVLEHFASDCLYEMTIICCYFIYINVLCVLKYIDAWKKILVEEITRKRNRI
jgi:hypothetical protein